MPEFSIDPVCDDESCPCQNPSAPPTIEEQVMSLTLAGLAQLKLAKILHSDVDSLKAQVAKLELQVAKLQEG